MIVTLIVVLVIGVGSLISTSFRNYVAYICELVFQSIVRAVEIIAGVSSRRVIRVVSVRTQELTQYRKGFDPEVIYLAANEIVPTVETAVVAQAAIHVLENMDDTDFMKVVR